MQNEIDNEQAATLAEELGNLKAEEAQAKADRIAKEEEIVALIGSPTEGSKTHDVGSYKITIKQPINVTVDQGDAALVVSSGESHPFKSQFKLDAAKLKALKDSDPVAYEQALVAITSKPGKIAVELKPVLL